MLDQALQKVEEEPAADELGRLCLEAEEQFQQVVLSGAPGLVGLMEETETEEVIMKEATIIKLKQLQKPLQPSHQKIKISYKQYKLH